MPRPSADQTPKKQREHVPLSEYDAGFVADLEHDHAAFCQNGGDIVTNAGIAFMMGTAAELAWQLFSENVLALLAMGLGTATALAMGHMKLMETPEPTTFNGELLREAQKNSAVCTEFAGVAAGIMPGLATQSLDNPWPLIVAGAVTCVGAGMVLFESLPVIRQRKQIIDGLLSQENNREGAYEVIGSKPLASTRALKQ